MDASQLGTLIVGLLGAIAAIGSWLSSQGARQRRDLKEARRELQDVQDREVRWRRLDHARNAWAATFGHDTGADPMPPTPADLLRLPTDEDSP